MKIKTDDIFTPFDYGNELIVSERKLPHWNQQNVSYFITFRLANSIPLSKLNEIKLKKENWEKEHQKPYTKAEWAEYVSIYSEKVQNYLDKGIGDCVLRDFKNLTSRGQSLDKFWKYIDAEKAELGRLIIKDFKYFFYYIEKSISKIIINCEKCHQKSRKTTREMIEQEIGDCKIIKINKMTCLKYKKVS